MQQKRLLGKIQPIITFLIFSCLLFSRGIDSFAQRQNPFELNYRKDSNQVVKDIKVNPFEKINIWKEEPTIENSIKPLLTKESSNFFLFIGLLLLLALLLTFLRSYAVRSIGAFGTENLFNFLYRDMTGRGIFPYLLLYIFFLVNLGVLINFSFPFVSTKLNLSFTPDYYLLFSLPFVLLIARHLFLTFIGIIFPVKKESDRYQFLMVVTGIYLGLIISPINIFFPYLPECWQQTFLFLISIIFSLSLAYHYLRGLAIGVRFIASYKFHFLLYICIVEIAPVLITVKLIINSL